MESPAIPGDMYPLDATAIVEDAKMMRFPMFSSRTPSHLFELREAQQHWLFRDTRLMDSSVNLSVALKALIDVAPVTVSVKWENIGEDEIMSNLLICREEEM